MTMPKWDSFLIFVFLKKYRLRYHEEEECTFPHSLWQGTRNSWVDMGDVKTKRRAWEWGQGGRRMFPNKLHRTA